MNRANRARTETTSSERSGVPLAELTTLRLGGPARRLVDAELEDQVVATAAAADTANELLLVIAGGSNLVITDAGFDGTVLRIATHGVSVRSRGGRVELIAAAGEPWDDLAARCAAEGLAGLECLSGIPGSTGATPIQNVGAYGQQVSDTIVSVRAYDRTLRRQIDLKPEHCSFAYRSSRFRHTMRYMVLAVTFALEPSRLAAPIRYPELARTLGVAQGARPPPFNALERRVAERLSSDARPPAWPHETGAVKTSAAWLIERAGFHRGYGTGRVGISRKHTLALVNRGGASTTQLIALAREIRDHVQEVFGVELHPEPTLVGVEL